MSNHVNSMTDEAFERLANGKQPTQGDRVSQLQELLPRADSAFILDCVKRGLDDTAAMREFGEHLKARLAAAEAKAVHRVDTSYSPDSLDAMYHPKQQQYHAPAQKWETELHDRLQRGMSWVAASNDIDRTFPTLRAEMIAADNNLSDWDEARDCNLPE